MIIVKQLLTGVFARSRNCWHVRVGTKCAIHGATSTFIHRPHRSTYVFQPLR